MKHGGLQPSDMDLVTLCSAVQERYDRLNATYLRAHGINLIIPSEVSHDLFMWNRLLYRYRLRDFRHLEDEKDAVRRFAQFVLDKWRELHNQSKIEMDWKD